MSRPSLRPRVSFRTKFLLPLSILAILSGFAVTAGAWFIGGKAVTTPSPNSTALQPTASAQSRVVRRNLSLQPEAFKFSRRVGQRFHTAAREVSTLTAMLTLGSERHNLLITRRQERLGESLTIILQGRELRWDHERGPRDAGADIEPDMHSLLERIALDSPDQFVLAQLRGASYQTIMHGVRPEEAGGAEDYMGPLYDIVRVAEPIRQDGTVRWRLFHINSQSGLIEKIISEEDGTRVEVDITEWREHQGEKFPTRLRWRRGGEPLMELTITNTSHASAQ